MSQKLSYNALIPKTVLRNKMTDRQKDRLMRAQRHAVCQIYTRVFIQQEVKLSLDFLLLQIQP